MRTGWRPKRNLLLRSSSLSIWVDFIYQNAAVSCAAYPRGRGAQKNVSGAAKVGTTLENWVQQKWGEGRGGDKIFKKEIKKENDFVMAREYWIFNTFTVAHTWGSVSLQTEVRLKTNCGGAMSESFTWVGDLLWGGCNAHFNDAHLSLSWSCVASQMWSELSTSVGWCRKKIFFLWNLIPPRRVIYLFSSLSKYKVTVQQKNSGSAWDEWVCAAACQDIFKSMRFQQTNGHIWCLWCSAVKS